jgi:hypothetical protein
MSAQLSATLWSTIVGSGTLFRPLIQLLKFPFSVPPKKFLTQRVVSRHVCRSSVKLSPTLSTVSPGRNGSWSTRSLREASSKSSWAALSAFSSKWPLISPGRPPRPDSGAPRTAPHQRRGGAHTPSRDRLTGPGFRSSSSACSLLSSPALPASADCRVRRSWRGTCGKLTACPRWGSVAGRRVASGLAVSRRRASRGTGR